MERSNGPRRKDRNRTAEQTAQSFVAAFLLGTMSGCATAPAPVQNARAARPATVVLAQPGDTVELIARRYKVSPLSIVKTNALSAPYRLSHGQRLVIPPASVAATWSEPTYATATLAARKPRQTKQADYAGTFETPAPKTKRATAKAEPIATPVVADDHEVAALDPRVEGARYYALGTPRQKPVTEDAAADDSEVSAARYASVEPRAKPGHEGATRDLDAPYEPPKKAKRTNEDDEVPVSTADMGASNGRFIWPVRGKVLAKFGARGSGIHNDGINIEADPDTRVKAADGGMVIYAGNELAGYGNLLLVRHDKGFVTAYAHNKKLLVKRGTRVKQGQAIALVGATGDVDRPQLHFEIRKGNRAVDPNRYLVHETASR
jgi:murein DD-endopeptidase MepM/ murein hydrolase activator NlpD